MIGYRPSAQQRQVGRSGVGPARTCRCTVHWRGPLDEQRLREAWQRAVQTHEILRTTFQVPAGMQEAYQIVNPDLPLLWDGECRLDPSKGPALHLRLQTLGPEEHEITVTSLA